MTKILYVFNSCKKSGPVKVMFNLISNLDFKRYEVMLVTIYEEENDSMLDDFSSLNVQHTFVSLNKKDILLGRTKKLKSVIATFSPNIIHTLGVFSDYAISRMKFSNHVITLHNYMYEDYVAKFGLLKGKFLIKLHLKAIKNTKNVVCCSKSIADMYYDKTGKVYPFIRNGVNNDGYNKVVSISQKEALRESLAIPKDHKVFVYSGQFIERKNQVFLLEIFNTAFFKEQRLCLLLLGNGDLLASYKEKYESSNIIFAGNVNDVESYLQASDFYISSSKSEGLPTGVLEGLSCGLPCILSDIPQHKEIVEIDEKCGLLYSLNDSNDCIKQIKNILVSNYDVASNSAYCISRDNLSSKNMAKNYMELYSKLS